MSTPSPAGPAFVRGGLGMLLRPLRKDPAVARTVNMLAADLSALRRTTRRPGAWPAAAIERAYHDAYAAAGPWLGRARRLRDTTDSPADRARWDAWLTRLTPPERSGPQSFEGAWVLTGQARDMLMALLTALVPCRSVGSVAAEIETGIRSGTLPDGHRVSPGPLARRLSVPVEHVGLALADLAAHGLVEVQASGHATVTFQPGAGDGTGSGRQRPSAPARVRPLISSPSPPVSWGHQLETAAAVGRNPGPGPRHIMAR
ncbi:hypothetical protein ACIQHY_12580 [Streptomyces sp. NPDC092359]|uniref:hypothetical protein n=1 Tax=Streptomyces sp. NPDC092359 TaxID=3366014 RepID=UPI0038022E69